MGRGTGEAYVDKGVCKSLLLSRTHFYSPNISEKTPILHASTKVLQDLDGDSVLEAICALSREGRTNHINETNSLVLLFD